MNMYRASVAEFVGTFALVFVGAGAIIVTANMVGVDAGAKLVAVALAHGLILGVMVSATMHISGGQLNPAVSLALVAIRKQPLAQAGVFIAAQLLGALAAAALLEQTMSVYNVGNIGATLGALTEGDKADAGPAFVLEVIATFFLMFVIMGTAVDTRGVGKKIAIGGLGIGLTLAAGILCIGPLTGGSMNPARSFGPALVSGTWDFHWLYWLAPIIGAAIAAYVYQTVFCEDDEKDDAGG